MKRLQHIDKRIFLVVGIVVLILLMIDYNNRMNDLTKLQKQLGTLNSLDAALKVTEQVLDTQMAYATSDQAVQEYAREQAKMVQTGDVPIVPMAGANGTAQPTSTPTATATQVENWQRWLALFINP